MFTDFPRETGAVDLRGLEQFADQIDLGRRKVASAVAHSLIRLDQAGRLQRVQHFHRFVQAHPTAPQDEHAGLSVALAPEVAAEFAEHAHDLAQAEGLGGRRQCLGHAQMQHLDFHHREDFGGRQVRLRASQERHMHQAYPDDAKEGQITLQALGLLEHAVLDLAARFEHLVQISMPQRFPYQRTFSAADSKSLIPKFVNNTQLIASLPAGGDSSVAPTRVTVTGSLEPDALARAAGRRGAWIVTSVTRTSMLAVRALRLPLLGTATVMEPSAGAMDSASSMLAQPSLSSGTSLRL